MQNCNNRFAETNARLMSYEESIWRLNYKRTWQYTYHGQAYKIETLILLPLICQLTLHQKDKSKPIPEWLLIEVATT
jgi:hypothetical protein